VANPERDAPLKSRRGLKSSAYLYTDAFPALIHSAEDAVHVLHGLLHDVIRVVIGAHHIQLGTGYRRLQTLCRNLDPLGSSKLLVVDV
jgi:hypothetical protein